MIGFGFTPYRLWASKKKYCSIVVLNNATIFKVISSSLLKYYFNTDKRKIKKKKTAPRIYISSASPRAGPNFEVDFI